MKPSGIDEKVDNLLEGNSLKTETSTKKPYFSKQKHKSKSLRYFLPPFFIVLTLLLTLLVPFFDPKYGIWSEDHAKDKDLPRLGDNQPYDYEYFEPPPNSFGMAATTFKTVNDTYYNNTFYDNITADLEYRVNNGSWQDGNDYLTLGKEWIPEDVGWKITTGFNNPSDKWIDARFTIAIDKECLSFVNKSENYTYELNFSVSGDYYDCIFNFSDLAGKADVIKQGIKNGKAYVRFIKYHIPEGYYEFDPWFGEKTAGDTDFPVRSIASGAEIQIAGYSTALSGGRIDNITVYLKDIGASCGEIKCGVYEYIDASSSYAGGLIAETTARDMSGYSNGWYTFNFSSTKPVVNTSDNYYLAVGAVDNFGMGASYAIDTMHQGAGKYIYEVRLAFEDPWTGESVGTNGILCIYAQYTEPSGLTWTTPSATWDVLGASKAKWTNPSNAVDDNTGTYATTVTNFAPLQLNLSSAKTVDRVRIFVAEDQFGTKYDADVAVSLYYDGGWNDIYNGSIPKEEWVSIGIPAGNKTVQYARVNATDASPRTVWLYEFDFGTWETDPDPPEIKIMYVGNESDGGGPFFIPGYENTTLSKTPFVDAGYFVNQSRQNETDFKIKALVTDDSAISTVTACFYDYNKSVWSNDSMWYNATSGYYQKNVSNSNVWGHKVTVRVKATDEYSNERIAFLNKSSPSDCNNVSKYFYIQCNATNVTNKPLYMYHADMYPDCVDIKWYDIMKYDQGWAESENDTQLYNFTRHTSDEVEETFCGSWEGGWFFEDLCAEPFTLVSLYYHVWLSSVNFSLGIGGNSSYVYLGYGRDKASYLGEYGEGNNNTIDVVDARSGITYNNSLQQSGIYTNDSYCLFTGVINLVTTHDIVDNNVYNIGFGFVNPGGIPSMIANKSISSFIIPNILDNTTLQGMDTDSDGLSDWSELYQSFTDPSYSDTDTDGISDYWENLSGSDPNNFSESFNYSWSSINSTINGSYINTTTSRLINNSINGSYVNVSVYHLVNDTINGSYINTTASRLVNNSINGSYINVTAFHPINLTINGSYVNVTTFREINSTINGSYVNVTTWWLENNSINGSYINVTSFRLLNNTINGSYINTTDFRLLNSSINGSYVNVTIFTLVNGSINGSYINTTSWNLVNSSINGSYINSTAFRLLNSSINGSYINVTGYIWRIVNTSINGSYINTSQWYLENNSINGSYVNSTSWSLVNNTINGSYINSTSWILINSSINGSYINTTLYNWQLINNSINGSYVNETITWNVVNNSINGSYINISHNMIITDEYPTNESNLFDLQPTVRFTLTNPTGRQMNYTIYTGNSSENCTAYLDNVSLIPNGTYHYVNYFNATNYTEYYYYRVSANDGTQTVDETFWFRTLMTGGGIISSGNGMAIAIGGGFGIFGLLALLLVLDKRKKRGR